MRGEDTQTIKYCMHGVPGPRKTVNTAPHDVGDPGKMSGYCRASQE